MLTNMNGMLPVQYIDIHYGISTLYIDINNSWYVDKYEWYITCIIYSHSLWYVDILRI